MHATPEAFLRAVLADDLRVLLERRRTQIKVFDYRTRQAIAERTIKRDHAMLQRDGLVRRIKQLEAEMRDFEHLREVYFEIMGKEE